MSPRPSFEKLHREFRPKILRYLTRLTGEQEAEDLTQEVFLKISKSMKRFRGQSQWSTWIYRIATNTAIDKIRAASRLETAPSPPDRAEEAEDRPVWATATSLSQDERLMLKEMLGCYREFIDRLPRAHRTVVVLSDLEEFSNPEIAKILGLSLETVKIRLHRGRSRLFREIRAHCSPADWPLDLVRRRS